MDTKKGNEKVRLFSKKVKLCLTYAIPSILLVGIILSYIYHIEFNKESSITKIIQKDSVEVKQLFQIYNIYYIITKLETHPNQELNI